MPIPNDVFLKVFQYLDNKNLQTIRKVSQKWDRVITEYGGVLARKVVGKFDVNSWLEGAKNGPKKLEELANVFFKEFSIQMFDECIWFFKKLVKVRYFQ